MSEADFPNQEPQTSPKSEADSPEAPATNAEALISTPASLNPHAKPIDRFEQRITPDTVSEIDPSAADRGVGRPQLREADWFSLARKLRQRNRDLLKKVASLEQDLATTQETLQAEMARSRSADTLNTQQSKELTLSQEKIRSLYAELEASHQIALSHQKVNEDLSEQLKFAQARIEELEREYTHLHQHYQYQADQLEDFQAQSKELAARLHRQQRQTLQFKAALDKCLESQAATPPPPPPAPIPEVEVADAGTTRAPLTLKATPIQPWSSPEDSTPDWSETAEFSGFESLTSDLQSVPESESDFPSELSEFEQNWREFMEGSEEIVVSALDDSFEGDTETVESTSVTSFDATVSLDADSSVESEPTVSPEPVSDSRGAEADTKPPSLLRSSPSPIVYPQRATKKRKSLAAIELPSFPRYKPS